VFEGNDLEVEGSTIYVNGHPVTTYTFKMDYYFMMGDNRHNSADSRFWGFVPEDHIVGKPKFIWLSINKEAKGLKKIRLSRIFMRVR
jgi:signal peptidase I